MKFQIISAIFMVTFQIFNAKKSFRGGKQEVDIDNKAIANSNALAINAGVCGDANAISASSATNYNNVCQKA